MNNSNKTQIGEPINHVFFDSFPKNSAYDLTLFFIPTPGLDWSTPGALTRSTLTHKLLNRPRSLGHTCVMLRTPEKTILTGMTQKHANEGRFELIVKGYGLGILFHQFIGELEKATELAPELLNLSAKSDKLNFLKINLSKKNAERMIQFFSEYENRGGDKWYGMRNRPRYLEGGGCGPFTAAVLEVAGMMNAEIESAWVRKIRIPLEYIGGPKEKKYISVLKMMNCKNWAEQNEPNEEGMFWDPTLMFEWVKKSKLPKINWNESVGVEIDASLQPPKDEPLFFV